VEGYCRCNEWRVTAVVMSGWLLQVLLVEGYCSCNEWMVTAGVISGELLQV
jgi:predicted nucleic acid-binding Zn finger protein